MTHEDGRVTLLPAQIRRLAQLSQERDCAIEVVQTGNVVRLNNGTAKLSVDSRGNDIHPPNQDPLC